MFILNFIIIYIILYSVKYIIIDCRNDKYNKLLNIKYKRHIKNTEYAYKNKYQETKILNINLKKKLNDIREENLYLRQYIIDNIELN
jgi:hypothetical protein